MNRTAARAIIAAEAARHAVVVYFTKRDGTARRMVCRYYGATSSRPHLLTVWDMEKGTVRSINLDTVRRVTVLFASSIPAAPERVRQDRPAVQSRRAAELQRELHDLF